MRSNDSSPEVQLRTWIKSVYLQKEALQQLRDSFQQQKQLIHLQLYDFLQQHAAATLIQHIKKSTLKKEYAPDKYSFHVATLTEPLRPFFSFLRSSQFFHYIKEITGLPLVQQPEITVFRFAHRDYTLLHDAVQQHSGLLLHFELTQPWDSSWGGYDVYSTPDEDPLVLQPQFNSLTFILLNKDMQHFTKYVNYLAGKHQRFFLRAFYPLS